MGKIGIMGGTFDPIHNGHLMLGEQAYQEYQLDRVWFMPSGQPPHKKDHTITDAVVRCEMTQLALEGREEFEFSGFEVYRDGYTYTYQTLMLLNDTYPQHDFYFIIGADSLYEIESWKRPELVMSQTTLLVAEREYKDARRSLDEQIHYLKQMYGANIQRLHCQEMDISSAMLREMSCRGESLEGLVPGQVAAYIRNRRLYQTFDCVKADQVFGQNPEQNAAQETAGIQGGIYDCGKPDF